MTQPVLELQNATRLYKGREIFKDINLEIPAGAIIALKGAPGSGKASLLKTIAGLYPITSGSIRIHGREMDAASRGDFAATVGLLLKDSEPYERLTVRENLDYFRRLYHLRQDRVYEVIQLLGLVDRENQVVKKLPVGYRTRLNLARVLLPNPSLLLLEEPTGYQDIETMEILRKAISKTAEAGTAVLIATSSSEEAQSLAHRTAVFQSGKIDRWDTQQTDECIAAEEDTPFVRRKVLEKIPARINDRVILFNPQELTYIDSQDGNSVLHSGMEQFSCPLTLAELEEKLKPFGFFRCHRSYIVNLQRVREIIPWSRNSFSLILDDAQKSTIPLSKNSLKELEEFLGL